jgi:hypothetical protein
MILSLVSIAVVLLIAYIWLTRGFFSALIHFLCTLIAGAIAFALWEPIGYAILDGTEGVGFIDGSAWGIALALPFAVSLILLRFVTDRVLRSNVIISSTGNYVGGGLLGAAAGAISVGIAVIALSYLRVDFLGAKSFDYAHTGNPVRKRGLWVPFDRMTVTLYGHLSERGLRTETPLARWQPAAHEMGNAMRMSPFEGKGRNTFRPKDFDVRGRFSIEGGQFNDYLRDRWNPSAQTVLDPAGQPYPANTRIEGFVVVFQAGSREKDGKSAIGAGQIMLVSENADGQRDVSFPIAVTAQAEPSNPGAARFRFDSSQVFIASAGSASESVMAFEFPVRADYKPVALFVKGVRVTVNPAQTGPKFAGASDRDAGLAALGVGNPAALPSSNPDADNPVISTVNRNPGQIDIPGFALSTGIPIFILQEGQHQNVEIRKNSQWYVVRGTLEATLEEARRWPNVTERNLRITDFMAVEDRVMVQVEVTTLPGGVPSRMSWLGKSLDAAEALLPPLLIDTNGEQYQPVGYVYTDETSYKMSFDPSRPIRSMSEMPALSKSRPAQRMILLFQVSYGRSIKSFNKGQKIIAQFDPPIVCDQRQANR